VRLNAGSQEELAKVEPLSTSSSGSFASSLLQRIRKQEEEERKKKEAEEQWKKESQVQFSLSFSRSYVAAIMRVTDASAGAKEEDARGA
jgi:hypothetical protein